jgi:hypothetical protein
MRIATASFFLPFVLVIPSGSAIAGPGWTLDVDRREELTRADAESSLGGGARRCLTTARFDAKANGFGSLFVLTDRAGEIRDARYLGFDDAPEFSRGFATTDLARKRRTTFDELGVCLRGAALGVKVGPAHRTEPVTAMVRFVPPG